MTIKTAATMEIVQTQDKAAAKVSFRGKHSIQHTM
jgi:hypothetical protein